MALYCSYTDPDGTSEKYYICTTDQYCCDVDQCCHINDGFHLPRLWYCWFLALIGILACSLISSKFCKKRSNFRHVTVSSRLPHHQPHTTIVHPSPVMANMWAMYPPSYSASNIMVTSAEFGVTGNCTRLHIGGMPMPPQHTTNASGRPYPQSTEYSAQSQQNSTSEGHLHPPLYSCVPGMVPQGANNPYPAPRYNTIFITDTMYDEPPSYESVVKTQSNPNAVAVN